jgi:hypothetical protein
MTSSVAGRDLPQLEGGCVNYFEAGNWALNDAAPPRGSKTAPEHRRMHMHIFCRSRGARHPSWRWGEAPRLPLYKDRKAFTATFGRSKRRNASQSRSG